MNRKNLSISLIAALAAIFLAACGSSSKPAPPQIMLAMDTPPPSTLEVNISVPLSASVVNDSSGGGIVWTLSCDQADCGTLTSGTSASGDTIGYTAPATVPESDAVFGGMALTVTATSATDNTVFASASSEVLVIGDTQLLLGSYAFYVEGFDTGGNLYTAAGSVNLDGMGNVLGGEEDFFDSGNGTPSVGDVVMSGTYSVNQNGPGTMTITVAKLATPTVPDPSVGSGGTQTFSLVAINSAVVSSGSLVQQHLLIEEFDLAATSIGSMDSQTFAANDLSSVTGGFAYLVNGADDSGFALGIGGVFTTDGAGGFTGDQSDENDGGSTSLNITDQGGGFTVPDANGRGTLTIGTQVFAYYQVNPEALALVETDGTQLTVGVALGQGASTGAFGAAAVGASTFGASGFSAGIANIAGQFATDGTALLTSGFGDSNDTGAAPGTGSITGTYTLAANGYGNFTFTGGDLIVSQSAMTMFGMYAIDPAVTVVDPNNPAGGGGALILDLDDDAVLGGVLAPQTDPVDSFESNNAISFGGGDPGAVDLVGVFLSDGVSNVTGAGDLNDPFGAGLVPAASLVGTFAADPNNAGRSTLSLTINGAATPNNVVLYQASPALNFNIDIDPGISTTGYIELQ